MSTHQEAAAALYDIMADLVTSPPESPYDAALVAERIHRARLLLTGEAGEWVSLAEAQRLLGAHWESSIRTWVRLGLLRGRDLPDGCLEIRLSDVVSRRVENEALRGIGGEDLSPEELRVMKETRPGKNPWERQPAEHSR